MHVLRYKQLDSVFDIESPRHLNHRPYGQQEANTSKMMISASEIAKHSTKDSCWIVLHGKVWDVTGMPL